MSAIGSHPPKQSGDKLAPLYILRTVAESIMHRAREPILRHDTDPDQDTADDQDTEPDQDIDLDQDTHIDIEIADMATKTEERGRITARAPQPVVDELEEAAALVGITVNQFIVQASTEKARTIIDAFTRVNLSRRDATFIANLLDDPPAPNEALQRAARRYEQEVERADPSASKSSRH